MVEFRLLGVTELYLDGHAVDLGPARQRSVLAVLLVDANAVVAVDQLIDRVWADQPPPSVRSSLHSYLTRLRRVLDPAGVSIVRRSGGYLCGVDEQTVDLHLFRHLVEQARVATTDERALVLVERALRLWRGEPFAGLDTPWLCGLRTALERERFEAELDRTDFALRCGRHTEVLATLEALAEQRPLDERVAGQLMLALYHSGRQADALAHYPRVRAWLADELGADPSPPLQRLHRQILTADPELSRPTRSSAVVPRQLPAPPPLFTGRAAELTMLDQPAPTMVISAIGGMGGVGKTWLALHWAHRNADRFPDGQLFVNLRGFDATAAPVPPSMAVRGFLDAFGVDSRMIPPDLDSQLALFRSRVAGRRVLILLDNARDAAQVAPLLPGSPSCTVLVTSRHQLTGLLTEHGAHLVDLDVLTDIEARTLLGKHLGPDRLAAEPEAVTELLRHCAGLPLAISIMAARLRSRPSWPIGHLTDRLTSDRGVAAAFSISYDQLTGEQQRLFRLLGLHPGPDISAFAAASLAACGPNVAEQLLEDLVDVHLLQQPAPGRYRFHDLLRQHAHDVSSQARIRRSRSPSDIGSLASSLTEVVQESEPSDRRCAALRRLVDHYLHTAVMAERLLDPHGLKLELTPPADGCRPRPLHEQATALTWFVVEHANLLAVQQLAAEFGWHDEVWQLAWAMNSFHQQQGHLHDDLPTWRTALVSAQLSGKREAQGLCFRYLGRAYAQGGQHTEAVTHLKQALTLAEQTNDPDAQAQAHHALAGACAQQGENDRALAHATKAVRLFEDGDNPVTQAMALGGAAWCHAQLGNFDQARECCEDALVLSRRHHYLPGEASTLDSLGYIALRTGEPAEALDYFIQALKLARDLDDAYHEADSLDHLALAHQALGQSEQARDAWRQAVELCRAQHRTADVSRIQEQLAST